MSMQASIKKKRRLIDEVSDLNERITNLDWLASDPKGSEERVRERAALLDILADAIMIRDLEGHVVFWNSGAEHLYGWTREEIIGKCASEFLYDETSHEFEHAKKVFAKKGKWRGELHQVGKNGNEVIVESRWVLMPDQEQRPKCVLVVNTDITEIKKLEAQFLRAQRMESIGKLAGGVAHDLNNVLHPITMAVNILQRRISGDENQQLLATLKSSARRGTDVVKQLLSFVRGVEGERVTLQVKHLIKEMEKIVRETFPKSIAIYTDVPEDLWTVSGDATQIHQVLMNLCVNARDAMPDGGRLTIAAENVRLDEHYASMNLEAKPGPYVALTVSDNGTGISADVLDKIFKPFFTTKRNGKGTGLGLATVTTLVKSHDGFVKVYSEVGSGTTFKVYLRGVLDTGTPESRKEEQPELPKGNGELVLVVDDEASIRDVTKRTLQSYGYQVLTAGDGTEAVAVYMQHKGDINVVLLDMLMPYLDGPATIRALQKIEPQIKIIATSGLAQEGKIAEVASAGVGVFLTKPYTAEKLLKTLDETLSVK